jgi:hypothetical protein
MKRLPFKTCACALRGNGLIQHTAFGHVPTGNQTFKKCEIEVQISLIFHCSRTTEFIINGTQSVSTSALKFCLQQLL